MEAKRTETELVDEGLDGEGDLIDEALDLGGQAVLVTGDDATTAGAGALVTTASDELSPELALGELGASGLDRLGDGVKVGLQLVGSVVLLRKGGVLGERSSGRVCLSCC